MLKILLFDSLLLIVFVNLAGADVYKCKRPDGTVIFTDNPSQVFDGCQREEVKDLPTLGTQPEPPQPQVPVPDSQSSSTSNSNDNGSGSFESLKSEAEQLIEQFEAARQRAVRSSYAEDKLQARRELAEIRAKKTNLLSQVDQSALNSFEKEEINGLLSSITE